MNLMPNAMLSGQVREFTRMCGMMPIDLHVVACGGLHPVQTCNLFSNLGSMTSTYQACALDFEPEKLRAELEKDAKNRKVDPNKPEMFKTPDEKVAEEAAAFEKVIAEDLERSFSVLTKCSTNVDFSVKVGHDSSRLLNMTLDASWTGRVVLPGDGLVVVERGTNTGGLNPTRAVISESDLKHVIALSIRAVINNFERYATEGKLRAVLKNLLANKSKSAVYYDLISEEGLQSLCRLLEGALVSRLSNKAVTPKEYAVLATRASRLSV
jgi:hypothetical protein